MQAANNRRNSVSLLTISSGRNSVTVHGRVTIDSASLHLLMATICVVDYWVGDCFKRQLWSEANRRISSHLKKFPVIIQVYGPEKPNVQIYMYQDISY